MIRSPTLDEKIIQLFGEGKTTQEIADAVDIGVTTLITWRVTDVAFDGKCSHAQQVACDIQVDNLNKIADETLDVNRARLKCDNIKWAAARRFPQRYGDRLDLNVTQTVDINSALKEARIRSLLPGRSDPNCIDAEYTEIKNDMPGCTTDCKSDDAEKPEQNPGPIDIFS